MQIATKTNPIQQVVAGSKVDHQSSPRAAGPTAISPDLLQLVSGGKGVAARQTNANAPVNKW